MNDVKGHVEKRRDKWWVVIELKRDAAGKRRRKLHGPFRLKSEATTAMNTILTRRKEGNFVEPSDVTVGDYFDKWFPGATDGLRLSTRESYARVFERYIRPRIGEVPLQDLDAETLNGLYAELREKGGTDHKGEPRPLSRNTTRHAHVVIGRMLNSAARSKKVLTNVARLAEPPATERPTEIDLWLPEQLGAFLRAVEGERLAALWRLLTMVGCRRGEALGAKWDDFEFERGKWEIRRSFGIVNGVAAWNAPKTGRGRRTVSLDAETVAALRSHKARQAEERLKWGPDYQDAGLVFCQENGEPLHPDNISHAFKRIAKQAGLRPIRLHGLRNSLAAMWLRAGAPAKVVSERLGHASTAFTQDVYAGSLADMQEDLVTAMSAILDAPAATSGSGLTNG